MYHVPLFRELKPLITDNGSYSRFKEDATRLFVTQRVPITGGFRSQSASNAYSVSIS